MFKSDTKRSGIGTVLTTLIILLASAILAAAIIFFVGSLFQAYAEIEAIQVSNAHIWVTPNGTSSVAGFVVQNTGDRVVSVQKISVRGQPIPTSAWFYNNSASVATQGNVLNDLKYDGSLASVDVAPSIAGEEQFSRASGSISLAQGRAVFIFLERPANISALDIGLDYTLKVRTERATVVESLPVLGT
jgi:hypothetical protein